MPNLLVLALDTLIKWMSEGCAGDRSSSDENVWSQLSCETRYQVRDLQWKRTSPLFKEQSHKLKATEDRLNRLLTRAREIEEHNRKTRDELLDILRTSKIDCLLQSRMAAKLNALLTFRSIY